MSNQNLKDVTASGVIMRIHRWLVKRRGGKKSLSKAANANFQPGNLSPCNISSLPASCMTTLTTLTTVNENQDFNKRLISKMY